MVDHTDVLATDFLATADSEGAKWNVLAKGYFNTEKVIVEAMKDFLYLTQSVQKTFLSGVVKNHKCLGKQMVKLVLPKRRIFCLIFNHLCDIKVFFYPKGKTD